MRTEFNYSKGNGEPTFQIWAQKGGYVELDPGEMGYKDVE
jgi:hypothetical protein